jgi:hypothetical protein
MSERTYGTVTFTTVSSSASSKTIIAANPRRRKLILVNTSTAILYLNFTGGTATATTAHGYQMASNTNLILDNYTGPVSGIWASANGQVNVTEFTV